VRDQCNGLATRAGLLITASALAASLFVEDMEKIKTGEVFALSLFGLATIVGVVTLVPA
jgi:hypothetical protein